MSIVRPSRSSGPGHRVFGKWRAGPRRRCSAKVRRFVIGVCWMEFAAWSALVGLLLIVMGLSTSVLSRLPLSTSMLYLAVGAAASPLWLDWAAITVPANTRLLERLAEVVVLVSLFTAGLKLERRPERRSLARCPLRLASVSMVVTVALIALAGSWRSACRSARPSCSAPSSRPPTRCSPPTCRSPTPGPRPPALRPHRGGRAERRHRVPASSCSVWACSACTTLGAVGLRWLAVDVVWAVAAGLGIGAGLGTAVGPPGAATCAGATARRRPRRLSRARA